ncbi:MAG: TIGR04372 family glycosyltransferase, partial [Gemmataceae bacterium]|nr:TIGR04372 family glycosyltransferase [Gemmataceae bacterium]
MRDRYLTDLTDAQWAALRRVVFPAGPDDLRAVVDAVRYREHAYCPWRLLPPGFPPADQLRAAWAGWQADGTWDKVRRVIAAYPANWGVEGEPVSRRVRRALGRRLRRFSVGPVLIAVGRPLAKAEPLLGWLGRVRRYVSPRVRRLPLGGLLLWPGRATIQAGQYVHRQFTAHAKLPGWFRQAHEHLAADKLDEAVGLYSQVLSLDPVNLPTRLRRAYCLRRLGRFPEAAADCWSALALPGLTVDDAVQAHYYLSEVLSLAGDLRRGLEHGCLARLLQRHGPAAAWEDDPPSGPDEFEALADAHNDLAELAINTRTDFRTAKAIYRSGEELQAQYNRWLGEVAPRTLFLSEDWVRNIGHIALLDFWVKMRAMGWGRWDRLVVLAPPRQTANREFLRYFKPFFHVVSNDPVSPGMRHMATALGRRLACLLPLPDGTAPYLPEGIGVIQEAWERQGRGPLLKLTPDDVAFRQKQLREMGVPAGAWFVALHVRSAGFHREGALAHQAHRNAAVESYLPAVREITARGGWVIRLGDPSMEPLPKMPRVVDYARGKHKSQRLDVILGGSARFFIGVTSGLCHLPTTFGVPCLLTNWVSNSLPVYSRHDLFLPKLLRGPDGRVLTFAEWLSRPVRDSSYSGESLIRDGYGVIDNTPDELAEATAEMLDGLDGRPTAATPDDLARRAVFDAHARAAGHRGFPPVA